MYVHYYQILDKYMYIAALGSSISGQQSICDQKPTEILYCCTTVEQLLSLVYSNVGSITTKTCVNIFVHAMNLSIDCIAVPVFSDWALWSFCQYCPPRTRL